MPTPKYGSVNFKLLLTDKLNKWKRIQFSFIATNNAQISAGYISFNSFTDDNKTKHNLASNIKVNDYMKTKPIIQTYISGVSIKSRMNKT